MSQTWTLAAAAALILSTSCNKAPKAITGTTAQTAAAQETQQRTFSSPEEAGAALVTAAGAGDRNTIVALFRPDSETVLLTGDPTKDKAALRDFATAYGEMHRWGKIKAGAQVLYVGADNQPFPIPLGQDDSGKWRFDSGAGKDEILARRIGRNELSAMEAAAAIAAAERRYFQQEKQYSQKLVSDPGTHNGLFWVAADGQTISPLGGLGDFSQALSAGSSEPLVFNGYSYRILKAKGNPAGFVVLAYPAEYQNSGIMSFLIGHEGTLYQKDLGEKTGETAAAMQTANPTDGWTPTAGRTGTASRAK